MEPQDFIDCTPQQKAFSGDANTTTLSQVKAAQESIMSGEANVTHCRKPLRNVPYIHTFGTPDQGQTLDV